MPVDFPVSWTEVHIISKRLSTRLKAQNMSWSRIVAVTRGGMVPACLVARDLGIRQIDAISVQSYDHQLQADVKVLNMPEGLGAGEGCLVIDDLSDTGNTFKALRCVLPGATYACLYVKPEGRPYVDVFAADVPQDTWIYLPWEDQDFPPHIMDAIGAHLKDSKDPD